MRGGDDDAVGTTEVEHDHGQTGGEHGNGQQAGERRARFVDRFAEHRTDRGDVEYARSGNDQEDGKDVGQSPDDLVVHAGDDVAGMFHIQRGSQADSGDQSADEGKDVKEALFRAAVLFEMHGGQIPW